MILVQADRLFLCVAFLLVLVSAPAPAQTPLIGLWRAEKRFEYGGGIVQTLGFSADGRFVWAQDASGDKSVSLGTYRVQGNQIVFQEHHRKLEGGAFSLGSPSGTAMTANASLQGTTLLLQGDLFTVLDPGDGAAHFEKQPGSEKEVADSVRASDEQERMNNDAWSKRVALGQIRVGATVAPTLPKDPNPGRVYGGATGFARPQQYTYINTTKQHVVQGDTEGGRNSVTFSFFPNGRVFAKFVTYIGDGPQVTVSVTTAWGRYSIKGDSVQVESDQGEKLALKLVDGRRNLTGLSTVLTQSDWLLEILQGRSR